MFFVSVFYLPGFGWRSLSVVVMSIVDSLGRLEVRNEPDGLSCWVCPSHSGCHAGEQQQPPPGGRVRFEQARSLPPPSPPSPPPAPPPFPPPPPTLPPSTAASQASCLCMQELTWPRHPRSLSLSGSALHDLVSVFSIWSCLWYSSIVTKACVISLWRVFHHMLGHFSLLSGCLFSACLTIAIKLQSILFDLSWRSSSVWYLLSSNGSSRFEFSVPGDSLNWVVLIGGALFLSDWSLTPLLASTGGFSLI